MLSKVDKFLDNLIDRAMTFVEMRRWEKEKRNIGLPAEWFEEEE